jgi:hypothetical protein
MKSSLEAYSRSCGHETSRLLWNYKFHNRVQTVCHYFLFWTCASSYANPLNVILISSPNSRPGHPNVLSPSRFPNEMYVCMYALLVPPMRATCLRIFVFLDLIPLTTASTEFPIIIQSFKPLSTSFLLGPKILLLPKHFNQYFSLRLIDHSYTSIHKSHGYN